MILERQRYETYNLLANYTYTNISPSMLVGCQTSLNYHSTIATPNSLHQIFVGLGDAAVEYYLG